MPVRIALPRDAQALALLGERLWRETYTGLIPESNLNLHLAETFGLAQQAAELADPACTMLVLEEAGQLLGYALLQNHPSKWAQVPFVRPMEVVRFYVDRSLHGRGAGGQLMAAALSHAAARGHDGAWLQVWDQNPRAIRFYAKMGFTDAGEVSFRIGEQVDRDRLLVRPLDARDATLSQDSSVEPGFRHPPRL
ncbi:N-acetyltransferase [Geothrix limicola]|uniref:N-acetyltransferase n=1 Tax=Geothrix limicola TaxID=2927978 RepID=A0ABQ5QAK5_9BACT|nr:GNAT family N-acetyltransferase [Geothrix limicola]GLH71860.1 N-acetyltransferase [Geothrix limicola]